MSVLETDQLTDVAYEVDNGLATITINRPHRLNSFRARTQRIVGEPLDRSGWSPTRTFQA